MDYILIYQELLSNIKNSKLSFELKEALNNIYNDYRLLDTINKYKITHDEKLRNKIYENKNFMRYKHLENETNTLILKLNKVFKELEGVTYESD